jgi:hypothetical protein
MSLSTDLLTDEIRKIIDSTHPEFTSLPATAAETASRWTDAYDTYAINATDVSSDALILANKAGFESALLASLPAAEAGSAVGAAQAFENAFIAYWTAATFGVLTIPPPPNDPGSNSGVFSQETTSIVTTIVPGVLLALLTAEFSIIDFASDEEKAASLADAFHNATTSAVIVLITGIDTTPSPSGPLPITNTNLIQ